ncbi:hypothetical protein [Jannaschia sp. LMIT008]|uniref:hypothetical protein n=1 Tax=Jannaschia maritima TaxID=3032585 RepID=UPI002811DA8F|nr:hypothetical protein [Jannaschia sp. LMIT008]
MPELHLAFYKARGTWLDLAIRLATRSRYSHVELVEADRTPRDGNTALCLSASARDRGVRIKPITFDPGKWDFVTVPWARADAWDRARRELGCPYDYEAAGLLPWIRIGTHAERRWFCSEICAHALGYAVPDRYCPGGLHRALSPGDRDHAFGRADDGDDDPFPLMGGWV